MITLVLPVATEKAPVVHASQIKWRSKFLRPLLEVADLGPWEELPCGHVFSQDVSVEDNQIGNEKPEQATKDCGYVGKHRFDVFED